jgi:L-ascorbate metabolism protein UlaG (beta-lactamase superfamily)
MADILNKEVRNGRRLTLVRNATIILEMNGTRLLLDPMLDDAGARPAIENTANQLRNPLVGLPIPAEEVLRNIDAVLITHLHRDHFDDKAAAVMPRDIPAFCQPEDEERLRAVGLMTRPVTDSVSFNGLRITRTGGCHGVGKMADDLGPVSGFIIEDVYVAGDTIWCPEVEQAITQHKPAVAVVNGGGACFVDSAPIVMTTSDIRKVAARVPTVVVVHLEAINHCFETREFVRAEVPDAIVPDDGETIELPSPSNVR